MRCRYPRIKSDTIIPCGQCLNCVINKRRTWAQRIHLETLTHSSNRFITLTFNDQHLPANNELQKSTLTLFLKRLRKRTEPKRFRYFAIGEYGDKKGRAHYHAILFGYPPCRRRRFKKRDGGWVCTCTPCWNILEAWGQGFIANLKYTPKRGRYVANYVTKKMTARRNITNKQLPFSLQSNKPGIGAEYAKLNAKQLLKAGLPIGRYLRNIARTELGITHDSPTQELNRYLIAQVNQLTAAPGMARFRRSLLADLIEQKKP